MIRYSAPDGMHDDCVMALAFAWSGLTIARQWVQEAQAQAALSARWETISSI
jgi:hypothetical protein